MLTMFGFSGSLFLIMVQQSPLIPWVSSGVVQVRPVVRIRLSALPLTWPIGWNIGSTFRRVVYVVHLPVRALQGQPRAGRMVRRGGPLSIIVKVLLQIMPIGTLGRGVMFLFLGGSLKSIARFGHISWPVRIGLLLVKKLSFWNPIVWVRLAETVYRCRKPCKSILPRARGALGIAKNSCTRIYSSCKKIQKHTRHHTKKGPHP